MISRVVVALTMTFALALAGETQIDPSTQIYWPWVTGYGLPGAQAPPMPCTVAEYGMPYTNLTPNPNVQYVCGADGWTLVSTPNVVSGTLTPGVYAVAIGPQTLGDGSINSGNTVANTLYIGNGSDVGGILIDAAVGKAATVDAPVQIYAGAGLLLTNDPTSTAGNGIQITNSGDNGTNIQDSSASGIALASDHGVMVLGTSLSGSTLNYAGTVNFVAGTSVPAWSLAHATVQVSAPSSLSTSYSLRWPTAQGSGSMVNDGAGNLSWGTSYVPPVGAIVSVPSGTLGAGAHTSPASVSVTGLLASGATSRVTASYTASPASLIGWGDNGGMEFKIWTTGAGAASWQLVNPTANSITYDAITFAIGVD